MTSQPIPRSLSDGDLLVSVRDRDWTYIENVDAGTTELYHRPSDPTQQDDRSVDPTADEQRVIERFAPLVEAHVAALRDRDEGPAEADMDEELETRLEALGYR